jgi:hypothetical protein
VVMNSLLSYEGLGGQVQMIYLDPPYLVHRRGQTARAPPRTPTRRVFLPRSQRSARWLRTRGAWPVGRADAGEPGAPAPHGMAPA